MVDEGRVAEALDKIRHAHPQTRLEGLVDPNAMVPLAPIHASTGLRPLGAWEP